jgi:hypothetical protein
MSAEYLSHHVDQGAGGAKVLSCVVPRRDGLHHAGNSGSAVALTRIVRRIVNLRADTGVIPKLQVGGGIREAEPRKEHGVESEVGERDDEDSKDQDARHPREVEDTSTRLATIGAVSGVGESVHSCNNEHAHH